MSEVPLYPAPSSRGRPLWYYLNPDSSVCPWLQASLLGRIHSVHVVPFHESGQSADGKVFWIVLEIVNGLTLREVLKTSGPLDEAEAIKVRRALRFGFLEL